MQKKKTIYKTILLDTNLISIIPEEECRDLLFEYFVKENKSIKNEDRRENIISNVEIQKEIEKDEELRLDSFYQIASFINLFLVKSSFDIVFIANFDSLKVLSLNNLT